VSEVLTLEQRESWEHHGFFRIDGFAGAATCEAMLDRVIEIVRLRAKGANVSPALVIEEAQGLGPRPDPEDVVSKVFRVARDPVFHEFATRSAVTDLMAELIGGGDVDCFLSQFIFKNPGAWGQPWHQDSWYFRFEPARPVVGVWLAVTEATLENGCLHVLPGSHTEPIHEHVPDGRPGANYGYMEIVDHDMSSAEPVLMRPGDLLVFDSHLMHRSTDNTSDGIRGAMVYHYAAAGTIDRTRERSPIVVNDWMPARRGAA
jgi:phytanoyl-CoA hydroxylase